MQDVSNIHTLHVRTKLITKAKILHLNQEIRLRFSITVKLMQNFNKKSVGRKLNKNCMHDLIDEIENRSC